MPIQITPASTEPAQYGLRCFWDLETPTGWELQNFPSRYRAIGELVQLLLHR